MKLDNIKTNDIKQKEYKLDTIQKIINNIIDDKNIYYIYKIETNNFIENHSCDIENSLLSYSSNIKYIFNKDYNIFDKVNNLIFVNKDICMINSILNKFKNIKKNNNINVYIFNNYFYYKYR